MKSEEEVYLNMFLVDCSTIQRILNDKANMIANRLLRQVLEAAWDRNTALCKKFQDMTDILLR